MSPRIQRLFTLFLRPGTPIIPLGFPATIDTYEDSMHPLSIRRHLEGNCASVGGNASGSIEGVPVFRYRVTVSPPLPDNSACIVQFHERGISNGMAGIDWNGTYATSYAAGLGGSGYVAGPGSGGGADWDLGRCHQAAPLSLKRTFSQSVGSSIMSAMFAWGRYCRWEAGS